MADRVAACICRSCNSRMAIPSTASSDFAPLISVSCLLLLPYKDLQSLTQYSYSHETPSINTCHHDASIPERIPETSISIILSKIEILHSDPAIAESGSSHCSVKFHNIHRPVAINSKQGQEKKLKRHQNLTYSHDNTGESINLLSKSRCKPEKIGLVTTNSSMWMMTRHYYKDLRSYDIQYHLPVAINSARGLKKKLNNCIQFRESAALSEITDGARTIARANTKEDESNKEEGESGW